MNSVVVLAVAATFFTWAITAMGAATVAFFKSPRPQAMNILLGFAAGVMISAAFWSLLQPAVERAAAGGLPAYFTVPFGFLFGAVFMWLSDLAIRRLKRRVADDDGSSRTVMLVLSITLHNIPEGLAVGVAFGSLPEGFGIEELMCAVTVAVGIGIQNFPEGAAVSLPLRREGCSRRKSFLIGQASGIVEPLAGLVGALAVARVEALLPFALSFAAGAMIPVAVHELIPECQKERRDNPYGATMGIVAGFTLMMVLDIMI